MRLNEDSVYPKLFPTIDVDLKLSLYFSCVTFLIVSLLLLSSSISIYLKRFILVVVSLIETVFTVFPKRMFCVKNSKKMNKAECLITKEVLILSNILYGISIIINLRLISIYL